MKHFKTLKNLLTLFALLAMGCGDNNNVRTIRGFRLHYGEGQGLNRASTTIHCDSFKMKSRTECDFWKDGHHGNIISTETIIIGNTNW